VFPSVHLGEVADLGLSWVMLAGISDQSSCTFENFEISESFVTSNIFELTKYSDFKYIRTM
jgi:hypothetical protein